MARRGQVAQCANPSQRGEKKQKLETLSMMARCNLLRPSYIIVAMTMATATAASGATMQRINEAYAVLSDANARRHYDRILADAGRRSSR